MSFQIKQGRVLQLAKGAFRSHKGRSQLFIRWNLFLGPDSYNPSTFFGDLCDGVLRNCVGGEQSLIVRDEPLHGRMWKKPGSLANSTNMPKVCSDQEGKKNSVIPRASVLQVRGGSGGR